MNKKFLLSLFVLSFVLLPVSLGIAADYFPKDMEKADNVVVSGDVPEGNIYVLGGTVSVNKPVVGDLSAVGGNLNFNSDVDQDLLAVGGAITVLAPVLEDARIAGGNLTINAPIGGDLMMAGGTVIVNTSAPVGGDMWIAGGSINVSNAVSGNAKIAGGSVYIDGVIFGDLNVVADDKLVFGPDSRVVGEINYTGRKEAVIEDGAEIGVINFTDIKSKKGYGDKDAKDFFNGFMILNLFAVAFISLVLYKLFAGRISLIVASYKRFWYYAMIGFFALILFPITFTIFFISIFGYMAGFIMMFIFFLMLMLSVAFSTMFLGVWAKRVIKSRNFASLKENTRSLRDPINVFTELSWMVVILGVLLACIISWIPVVGMFVMFVIFLAQFGAMLSVFKNKLIEN